MPRLYTSSSSKVKNLAKRFGKYVADPGGRRRKLKNDPEYYYKKCRRRPRALPSRRSGCAVSRRARGPRERTSERDHQPHNDLIETMAKLPAFAAK